VAAASIARQDAEAAHAELAAAQTHFMQVTRILWSARATDRDLIEANQSFAAATAAFQELAEPILALLAEQSDYRAAREALVRSQQDFNDVCSRTAAFSQERIVAGRVVLAAKARVARLESDAFGADPDVVAAKQRSLLAAQHLREPRAQLVQAVHQDPSYLAARRALDEATEKAAGADQQLAAAQKKLAEQAALRSADWFTVGR